MGMSDLPPEAMELLGGLLGKADKDRWAAAQNANGKVAFNVAKSPYEVWDGRYTQIRPKGATFEHPEGIDAAWKKIGGK